MKCKKIMAMALAGSMILSQNITSLATTTIVEDRSIDNENTIDEALLKKAKVSEEEAVAKANEFLKKIDVAPLDDNYDVELIENDRYYSTYKGLRWDFDFRVQVENGQDYYDLSVDAISGEIIRYSGSGGSRSWNSDSRIRKIKTRLYTEEQCYDMAEIYLKQLRPDKADEFEYREVDSNYLNGYYTFGKKINGIFSPYQNITIAVDPLNGKLVSYSANIDDDVIYEEPINIKTVEEVKSVIDETLSVEYGYELLRDRNYDYSGIKGVYRAVDLPYQLDATNLEEPEFVRANESTEDESIEGSFTITAEDFKKYSAKAVKIEEVNTKKGIIASTKAFISAIAPDKKFKVNNAEKRINYRGKEQWEVDVEDSENNNGRIGNIEFNSEGKLTEFYFYSRSREDEETLALDENVKPIDIEEFKARAIEILCLLYPEKVKEVNYTVDYDGATYIINDQQYNNLYYNFKLKQPGLENHYDAGIELQFGGYSGELRRVENNWRDIELPTEEGAIGAEKAREIIFDTLSYELTYVKLNDSSNKASLVYSLDRIVNGQWFSGVDAITGKLVGYGGEEILPKDAKKSGPVYNAELTLRENNIMDESMAKEYSEKASQKDLVLFMLKAIDSDYWQLNDASEELKFTNITEEDENYNDLRLAVFEGFVENKAEEWNWDAPVTRQEMAKQLIMALGYEDLGRLSSLYTLNCKDVDSIDEEYKGYIAMVEGLNLMTNDEKGNFNPKSEMTFGDMVIAVYNLMTK